MRKILALCTSSVGRAVVYVIRVTWLEPWTVLTGPRPGFVNAVNGLGSDNGTSFLEY